MTGSDYPAAYQVADASSVRGQRWFKRLTGAQLTLVLAGAVAGVVAAEGGPLAAVGPWAAAISFLGAGAVTLVSRQGGFESDWFNGRAVAETVKSLTWRYMTRTPPFDNDATADTTFVGLIGEALRSRPLRHHPSAIGGRSALQITARMRAERAARLDEIALTYREARLRDQAEWYRHRAHRHQRGRDVWFSVSIVGQGAAVLFAIASGFSPPIAKLNLLGVAASIVAAATAWAQVNRYDEQGRAYALAYQELLLVLSAESAIQSPDELVRLVLAGESVISREHTLWVAKRIEPLNASEPAEF
jgi:hypothetical protein